MKYFFSIILLIQLQFISCNDKYVTISVYNKTDNLITDMSIYVQGKKFKIENIGSRKKMELRIQKNEIPLNSHDFRIETTLTNKYGKRIRGFYYSDISASPNSKYTMEVYDSVTLIK